MSPIPILEPLSRDYTSDFLLAIVMQFFWKLLRHWQVVVATRVTKSVILSRKVQLIEFIVIFFFCDFFSFRHRSTCMRVATHVIFTMHWWCDNLKKSHHHGKQKIACVAAALWTSLLQSSSVHFSTLGQQRSFLDTFLYVSSITSDFS